LDIAPQHEREVRAARNQALFRTVNEKLRALNDSFATLTERFTIACECADMSCTEMLEIDPREYEAMRAQPRHFAVLPGHVYPDVDRVARESNGYVVVEKAGTAADVAEILARDTDPRQLSCLRVRRRGSYHLSWTPSGSAGSKRSRQPANTCWRTVCAETTYATPNCARTLSGFSCRSEASYTLHLASTSESCLRCRDTPP
jgi:hypothetical protein